jgi:alpha-1,3-fucosyltransferase
MTYRTDSDIPNLYGKLVPTSKRAKIAAQNGSWLQYDPEKRPPNVSPNEERTQDIAWMVSHCQTNSHREKVVNKLRQATNLTIDIYGKCGDREHRLKPETSDQIG